MQGLSMSLARLAREALHLADRDGLMDFGTHQRRLEHVSDWTEEGAVELLRPMLDRLEGRPIKELPAEGFAARAHNPGGRSVMVIYRDGTLTLSAWMEPQHAAT